MGRDGARRLKGGAVGKGASSGGGASGHVSSSGHASSGGGASPSSSSKSSLVFSTAGLVIVGGLALVTLSRAFLAAKLQSDVNFQLESGPPRHMLDEPFGRGGSSAAASVGASRGWGWTRPTPEPTRG